MTNDWGGDSHKHYQASYHVHKCIKVSQAVQVAIRGRIKVSESTANPSEGFQTLFESRISAMFIIEVLTIRSEIAIATLHEIN